MILLPQGLKALKQVAKQVGADVRGASTSMAAVMPHAIGMACSMRAHPQTSQRVLASARRPSGGASDASTLPSMLRMRVERPSRGRHMPAVVALF